MSYPNIFKEENAQVLIQRIHQLTPNSQPRWGKMNAAQMLAHCNVQYELYLENKQPPVKGLKKWLMKTFVKSTVVSEKPYPKNSRTAKVFLVSANQDFEKERNRLKAYLLQCVALGASYFEGFESPSFGRLSSQEMSILFYKHIDHHLNQFGV